MTAPARFLSRWSRLKLKAPADAEEVAAPPMAGVHAPPAEARTDLDAAEGQPGEPLPETAGLTLDSDFTAFLKEEVGEAVRRQALKKLFNDPHFNVMDGLDIYIDDYSVPAPIPPELMAKMRSAREWLAVDEAAVADAALVPEPEGESVPAHTQDTAAPGKRADDGSASPPAAVQVASGTPAEPEPGA